MANPHCRHLEGLLDLTRALRSLPKIGLRSLRLRALFELASSRHTAACLLTFELWRSFYDVQTLGYVIHHFYQGKERIVGV